MIGIYIPTFHRVKSLERAVANIHDNTVMDHKIYFIIEPDDIDTLLEADRLGIETVMSKYPGCHTGAANTAYQELTEPFFMMANDDFNFHPKWDINAITKMDNNMSVVGVNDGMGNFTPITLVRRKYVDDFSGCIDTPGVLYFPGYNHNYVDTEFAATAKKRGVWTEAPESIVEHMHWSFHKADKDATYIKSESTSLADSLLYEDRKHLFT